MPTSPATTAAPGWIGGYRIIRKIGEGGMGIVYEAEQQNPRRSVALKVIRGGPWVDDHAIRLFRREAQSLARLKHAGIAQIHEAGHTEDGQPFLVMEFVQGAPLDEYVRRRPLEEVEFRSRLHSRLHLFQQVCAAIHYAHQRGVIHRDLKPRNILLVGDPDEERVASSRQDGGTTPRPDRLGPQVKVLDFGLARIVDPEAGTATDSTDAGRIHGSLPYMSPEQARGATDAIDVRTDVYSLGVILYELVTDQRPYGTEGLPIHEAIQAIWEQPPRRPSTIRRQLRGDLETVVLKALEKDPDRRYQSVLMLAEDVERFLGNQPILARPASTLYQIRKLIARHRGAFAFAVTVFVLLIAFAVTMSVMFQQQRRARLQADIESNKAKRINEFLQGMLSSIDPEKARGREVTVREVLDEAAGSVESGLADQAEVQAAVRTTIGLTYMALGAYDAAEPQLRTALAAKEAILGSENPEVAGSLIDLGALRWKSGDYKTAEELFQRALSIQRRTVGTENEIAATGLNNLSTLYKTQGRYAEAESLGREALAIRRRIFGAEHADVAVSLTNLATVLQAEGKLAPAELCCREALAMRRKLFGETHPDVALSLNNLASILQAQKRYGEAEPLLRASLALGRSILGAEHPSVVSTVSNLAIGLYFQDRYAEAESLHREAIALTRMQLGENHPALASALNNLGLVLQAEGRLGEAEATCRSALAIRRRSLGPEHPAVATTLNNLAFLCQQQRKYDEAEQLYRESLAMRRKLLGVRHSAVAGSLLGLGTLDLECGRAAAAEPRLRECLDIRRATNPPDTAAIAAAENALGACLTALARYAEAESLLVPSTQVLLRAEGTTPVQRREAVTRAARLYEVLGDAARAAAWRERLEDAHSGRTPLGHPSVAPPGDRSLMKR